ncbi:hypothetical protein ATCC90586_011448 [Pythium insidiosum]|nr:hypothetical protein ATCC90586_011448 [Pythium insidiosum]
MGSYISVVNNTQDVWMCSVGADQAALKIFGIFVTVVGAIATVLSAGGAAAPFIAYLSSMGFVSILGIPTGALITMTSFAATVSTGVSVFGSVSKYSSMAANGIANNFGEKGYRVIEAGKKSTWGKMSLSLWQQSHCVKVVIVDERTVRTDSLYMRPIFSGATVDSNRDHDIQWWLNKNGVESMTSVANPPRKLEEMSGDEEMLIIYPNGTITSAADGHVMTESELEY